MSDCSGCSDNIKSELEFLHSETDNTDLANEFETRLIKRFPSYGEDWYTKSTTALLGPTMQQLERTQAKLATANDRIADLESIPSVAKMLEFEKEIGAVLPDLLMRLHEAQMLDAKHPSEGD